MAIITGYPATTASSDGGSITSNGYMADPFTASNVTWTEVIASTVVSYAALQILVLSNNHGMFHVAVGASGSEQRILTVPLFNENRTPVYYELPTPEIAAGSRISVGAVTYSAATIDYQIRPIVTSVFDAAPTFTVLDCGPFDLANSSTTFGRGITIDPGATANTKGAWAEMSNAYANNVLQGDSLANSYSWFGPVVRPYDKWTSDVEVNWLWDLGVGASGSEVAQIENAWTVHPTYSRGALGAMGPQAAPLSATTGDRVAMRCQSNVTVAGERELECFLFGIR